MKHFNIKIGALAIAMALGTFTSCQQEDDNFLIEEEISSVKEKKLLANGNDGCSLPDEGSQLSDAIGVTDFNRDINTEDDDRSCKYGYTQSGSYGVYKLTNADNRKRNDQGQLVATRLQTRIERSSPKQFFGNGKFLQLKSTVKILDVGEVTDNIADNQVNDGDGTYIAQVKGTHTGGGGSKDPAIMLFIAKPKRTGNGTGDIIRQGSQVKEFKIFAEVVKKRGGSNTQGRRMIYITTVKRNTDFKFDVRTEFYTKNGKKRQRIKYNINNKKNTVEISQLSINGNPSEPKETRIRMGAYRCKGETADIRWKKDLDLIKN